MEHACFYDLNTIHRLLETHGFTVKDSFYEDHSMKHLLGFLMQGTWQGFKKSLALLNHVLKSASVASALQAMGEPIVPDFGTQVVIFAVKE
jgi:hypothetical protein